MHSDYPGWKIRDELVPQYRHMIFDKAGVRPFLHQARYFAYCDGRDLEDGEHDVSEVMRLCNHKGDEPPSRLVHPEFGEFWLVNRPVWALREYERFGDVVIEDFPTYDKAGEPVMSLKYVKVTDRVDDPADVVGLMGSFKVGKSVPGGASPAAALLVPGVEWRLIGMEYGITMREFDYVTEFLLSENGLNLPDDRRGQLPPGRLGYVAHADRPHKGQVWLKLNNGSTLMARSWSVGNTPGDSLKGDEADGHTWSEFYQMPGLHCLLEVRQNLEKRKGRNEVPTTPDRPVVEEIINRGMSEDPLYRSWRVVSDIKRKENPYAFSFDKMLEEMDSRTKESWLIHWEGKTGEYVGSVYDYVRGTCLFTPETHPDMWKDPKGPATPDNLDIPEHWIRRMGCDTGTFTGACPAVFDEQGNVFFLGEFCNYRYVGGSIERRDEITIPELVSAATAFLDKIGGNWRWVADWNSQWKGELRSYGVSLHKGERSPELRTERTREYFQHGRAFLAPWLQVLPYELEHAKFPDRQSSTGINKRVSVNDHVLDPAEHACATVKRETASAPAPSKRPTWLQKLVGDAQPPMTDGEHPIVRGM